MIKFRSGAPVDMSLIGRMAADWRPEIAPNTGYLHAHILFQVPHQVPGGVHLDIPAVKRIIASYGTTPQVRGLPYINVKGFSSREDLLRYLSKGDVLDKDPQFGAFIRSGKV